MDGAANDNISALHLLEMAFEAKVCIAHGEHLGVDRAMRTVTGSAAFMHRFVFEDIRTALIRVTLKTSGVLRSQRRTATDVRKSFMG